MFFVIVYSLQSAASNERRTGSLVLGCMLTLRRNQGSGSAYVNLEVCTVAPPASLSRADPADQRHLGVLKGGVTSPVEVLLNDGGPGGTVGLERVDACLAWVAVEGQKHLSWLSIVHGEHEKLVHEPLVDMCDVQEGQNHLSWPSVVHGEHETMLYEPLVVKCDVQEGQKFLSWQSVMHGEHAK
ncbi:hypothetical protein ACOSQ3_014499 [Xanthoceras sorbifolium]